MRQTAAVHPKKGKAYSAKIAKVIHTAACKVCGTRKARKHVKLRCEACVNQQKVLALRGGVMYTVIVVAFGMKREVAGLVAR